MNCRTGSALTSTEHSQYISLCIILTAIEGPGVLPVKSDFFVWFFFYFSGIALQGVYSIKEVIF